MGGKPKGCAHQHGCFFRQQGFLYPLNRMQNPNLVDVERIEVLRGQCSIVQNGGQYQYTT